MADYIYREALQNYIDEMDFIDDREVRAKAREEAIDEFLEEITKYCSMSDMNRKMIKQIAEQLKAGGK